MVSIIATNAVASRPPKHRLTGTLTNPAKYDNTENHKLFVLYLYEILINGCAEQLSSPSSST